MIHLTLKLVALSFAGGACGLLIGSGVGIVCTPGPCPMFQPGYSGVGAILGAGVGALAVLTQRPDPRAFNRQDPPMPPSG